MENKSAAPNDIKKIFMKKGACSHTGYFVLNREFGYNTPNEERASDLLAGGLANRGFQCGMLWGCSLSIGAECYRKYNNPSIAADVTISTMGHIISSFVEKTGTPDCRAMTKCDFSKPWGLIKYLVLNVPKGLTNSVCFNVAEQWLPVAAELAKKQIAKAQNSSATESMNCASQVVKMAGGSDEECAVVAGFAGGLGLSGNACGALAAAIWFRLLGWCRDNPGKIPSYFNNKIVNRHLKSFLNVTDKEMICSKICGKQFISVNEHAEFVRQGGCSRIIEVLSNV